MTSSEPDPEILADAFQRWWDADYSLEGLRKKPIRTERSKPSTLHHYWMGHASEPRTVRFAGRDWSIFHLPLADLLGNPSEKANWTAQQVAEFYNEIVQRENEGAQAYLKCASRDETDRPRAFFDGVVFPEFGKSHFSSAAMPSYADAIFEGVASFDNHSTQSPTIFRRAIFKQRANFNQHTFQIRTDFDGAVFLALANFDHANLTGPASFRNAVFCGASFNSAGFQQEADFSSSEFHGDVSFNGGASAVTILDGTIFNGDVSFRRRQFHGPILASALTRFNGYADFRDCEFLDLVNLPAQFVGAADFSFKTGGKFHSEVDFSEARFLSHVDFSGREFLRSTRFVSCLFKRAPQFHGATPHSSTTFSGSLFEATVGEAITASFWSQAWQRSKVFTLLLRATARGLSVILSQEITPSDVSSISKEFLFDWVPFAEWLPTLKIARDTRNASTKELEDSYRTLRHLMESDGELAGLFYSLEMSTRRRRTDVSSVERWILFLFWLSSGYGRFLGRPFLVLLGAILTVTLLLSWWVTSAVWPDIPPSFGDVFAFSSRLFLLPSPFPAGMDGGAKVYWVASLLKSAPVTFTLLSAGCAIISTALVGVLAVTLRRRFALK